MAINNCYAKMWNQQFNSLGEEMNIKVERKGNVEKITSDMNQVRRRRQLYSSRMQRTVWSLLDRKALTLDCI